MGGELLSSGGVEGAAAEESSSTEGMIFLLTPFHRTSACTRPRISLPLIESLPLIILNARRVMPGVRRFVYFCHIVVVYSNVGIHYPKDHRCFHPENSSR